MQDEHWGDGDMKCFGMLLDGRAQTSGIRQRGKEATLLLVINGHSDLVVFTMPECAGGTKWSLLVDTNITDDKPTEAFEFGSTYQVTAYSFLVFALDAVPIV